MNIAAVAKHAQVSTATVSRVLNGTAKVSPATRERVRAAVAALNYVPNTNARALGSGRSNLYGLIISDITNPYFPELVKAFEDVAVAHGQEVLIANTDYDPERMEMCVVRMLQRKVDGVAIMTSEMQEHLLEHLNSRGIPLVFMDIPQRPRLHVVRVDYAAGITLALEHLIALRHERIVFISGPPELGSARVRLEVFERLCRARGLTSARIEQGNHRVDGGHAAMKRLLARGDRPTAVMASNDLTAIGAMGAIHEASVQIPEQISVVGFDDIGLSAYTQPALTTLHVPRGELATAAFRSLYQRQKGAPPLKSGALRREAVIAPQLVVRRSTAERQS